MRLKVDTDLATPKANGWVRIINDVQNLCAHGVKVKKPNGNPGKIQEPLDATDKPLIASHVCVALGCVDGLYELFA